VFLSLRGATTLTWGRAGGAKRYSARFNWAKSKPADAASIELETVQISLPAQPSHRKGSCQGRAHDRRRAARRRVRPSPIGKGPIRSRASNRLKPEVRSTAFTARPPDLPPRPLMTVDFAISCSLVRPGRPRCPVFVHRAAALLHAFFRPHLTMTPLRFANPSPSSGWIEDFHLQAVVHTRHTTKSPGLGRGF
jgi:hypothetical protein